MSNLLDTLHSVLGDSYQSPASAWLRSRPSGPNWRMLSVTSVSSARSKFSARLQHPNILPLHASGEANGLLYYLMPYVEGESLRARLEREGQLPIEDALQIARQVADALAYRMMRRVRGEEPSRRLGARASSPGPGTA